MWGDRHVGNRQTVRNAIRKLRSKLGDDARNPGGVAAGPACRVSVGVSGRGADSTSSPRSTARDGDREGVGYSWGNARGEGLR